ncbi:MULTISPECIES: 3-keto-5-aminohexanoate cleavage protein [unclassified Yoonia]|uniref:3-keto-5-aminohexanoate cleavage protein n=1 Tax=unclassified Yoonia TaxID=2629118 RepID=UPI002AFF2847|nr:MULTISPECIES: 3-keto-5-aminohexanoate cleavage protein [unclassified Yoonia]
MTHLPTIMVAPNGARRGKADHPALPVTIAETVATARACHAAGAGAIHAHVRDADGAHVLDAGLYAELIAEIRRAVPALPVQITTEAVGIFTPADQRALLRQITPEAVSIALAEMLADGDQAAARRSYHALAEAGVAVQHILYDPAQVRWLAEEIAAGTIPADNLTVLYVLGRYTKGQVSAPEDLSPFLAMAKQVGLSADWAICAFGQAETECLMAAHALGGKIRVGFENNLHMADGSIAADNAMRVAEIARLIRDAH